MVLHVKPYEQSRGHCGPASLKMVLGYFGVEQSERRLAQLSGSTKGSGVGAQGLIVAARQCGLKGFYKDFCDNKDIRYYVNIKKIPVIVDWFSPFPPPDGHYSVVVGIDRRFIKLMDPQIGRIRRIDFKTFNRLWFDFSGDYVESKKDIIIRRMIIIARR